MTPPLRPRSRQTQIILFAVATANKTPISAQVVHSRQIWPYGPSFQLEMYGFFLDLFSKWDQKLFLGNKFLGKILLLGCNGSARP